MVILALSIEEFFVQFGLGGGALFMLYVLVKPLISAQIRMMSQFMQSLNELSTGASGLQRAQAEISSILVDLRKEMQEHFKDDHEVQLELLHHVKDLHSKK